MQQSGRVHPGPVGLAHEVQLLPQLECSRQMQPPPAPLPHEQLMSGLLLGRQNSQWDPHDYRQQLLEPLRRNGAFAHNFLEKIELNTLNAASMVSLVNLQRL